MFNPNFDPYEMLKTLAKNQETMSNNIMEIARAFNQRSDQQDQIIQALNNQANILVQLEDEIKELKNGKK